MSKSDAQWWELAQKGIVQEVKRDKAAIKDIEMLLMTMIKEIEKEIMSFYAKYANREGLNIKRS
ncbi:hypothetical protein [Staphylococcus lugdunensis]|uniref:hypothetical protein n=1 Tax=Staphylococcus lugdunensis TaxID=28035 RepID=UPI0012488A5D|nr:hypothetical protein [Staphylococcus lugdunensis]QEX34738.1 hypothetical protein FO456_11820 [Staphylococcus lugdunensis]